MIASEQAVHRGAVTDELTLYHVVHPYDSDRDEWTQHYDQARGLYVRFAQSYGQAHLHVDTFRAGQYEAVCLLRTDRTKCMRHAGRAAIAGGLANVHNNEQ
jgi:hypothetical protein